ncbi:unnamed protein product [Eruca vesicaria subsp. sativa]|uniref:Secreted protein n=1 Tax=Eruca vesicaria subsp. sativa TaxID=29727 RepID=A0ABC8JC13_ERUVS|nr:unnamed protein product [Eruca vesicaria subsp. sativa]
MKIIMCNSVVLWACTAWSQGTNISGKLMWQGVVRRQSKEVSKGEEEVRERRGMGSRPLKKESSSLMNYLELIGFTKSQLLSEIVSVSIKTWDGFFCFNFVCFFLQEKHLAPQNITLYVIQRCDTILHIHVSKLYLCFLLPRRICMKFLN